VAHILNPVSTLLAHLRFASPAAFSLGGTRMKKMLLTATGLIALSIPAMAQNAEVRVTPNALVWTENPAFPKGVQIATLVGDPTKSGEVVVLRIKFPPNFQMPPHTHPYSEVVTHKR
jgi:hypothetical protein